ncbi:MAG TPA: lipase family protein [Acidimicrobiales bacterium]
MRTIPRALAAAVTVAALAVGATACAPPPTFYEPPPDLGGRPGDVLASVPTNFGANGNVTATALKYRSTNARGEPNYVTGTLLVPKVPWTGGGPRPLVSFAPGTQGIGDDCAASTSMPNGLFYQQAGVQALLDKGWAVAVTDYEGIGTPGDHTYVIKDAEAHALLDIVRAAQRLPGSGVAADAPVAFMGYSQGGQAAAAAAEREATYAPELNVVGTAAGGVPSDLGPLAEHLNGPGNLWFTFLAFAALGLDTAYPELDLEAYLNETGRQLLEQGRDVCLIDGLPLGLGRRIEDLTTTNPLTRPEWQARIAEQRLGEVAPAAPVLLYHGVDDQIIPFSQGTRLRDDWCALGARVEWQQHATDHIFGVFIDPIPWIEARFQGRPFTPTCN